MIGARQTAGSTISNGGNSSLGRLVSNCVIAALAFRGLIYEAGSGPRQSTQLNSIF